MQNGRRDIANLANDTNATAIHARELDKLIQGNGFTNRENANGLKIATCCTDC
jgi:hypothetical protein